MGRIQYEELSCPFCDKGKIQAGYIPGVWTERRTSRSSLGKGKVVEKSSDIWLIKFGCNVCNKSKKMLKKN